MTLIKTSSKGTEACPTGEVLLAAGEAMAMRALAREPVERPARRKPEAIIFDQQSV